MEEKRLKLASIDVKRKGKKYKVLLDKEDLPKIKYAINITANGYAVTRDETGKIVLLHRFLMGVHNSGSSVIVDHVNHNKLDCRKINLRLCNQSQNEANKRIRSHSNSNYKGVQTRVLSNGEFRYDAYIRVSGKKKHLGTFKDEAEAANMYDTWALKVFGEFAYTNEVSI